MGKHLLLFIFSILIRVNSFAQISLLECYNIGWPGTIDEAYTISYSLDCQIQEYLGCGSNMTLAPQILVAVISADSCKPWATPGINPLTNEPENLQNNFGQLNNCIGCCGRTRPWNLFAWQQANSSSMASLSYFLGTVISDNSYILIYTWIPNPILIYNGTTYSTPGTFSTWDSNVLQSFLNLGFTQLDTIPLNYPWIFFCKKGDLSSAIKVIGTHPEDTLDFTTLICSDEPFISSNSLTICEGDTAVIYGNQNLMNYQWSTGDTTAFIFVTDSGYYSLTGLLDSTYQSGDSTYNQCYYSDSIFIEVVSCTGIEEWENNFSVFPNPANEITTLNFSKALAANSIIGIYNILGELKEEITVLKQTSKLTLSLSSLSPGLYFIQTGVKENHSISVKIVVIK